MSHDHAVPEHGATPVANEAVSPADADVHRLVASHGANAEGLADGIVATQRTNDMALWAALQRLLGNGATQRVRQHVVARRLAVGAAPAPDACANPGIPVTATSTAALDPKCETAPTGGPTATPGPGDGAKAATTTATTATTTATTTIPEKAATPHPEKTATTPTTEKTPEVKAEDATLSMLEPDRVLVAVERMVLGVKVIASVGTHKQALDACATFITAEVGKNELAQKKFKEAKVTIVIMPAKTAMTDLPQFAALKGQKTFDGRDWASVRGSGGVPAADGNFAIGIGEETLIDVMAALSAYPTTYSVGMHELAHSLQSQGMTSEQQATLAKLYKDHAAADPGNKKDTFTDDYAASNDQEYFAQATNAFFGRNTMGKNHDGRDWLKKNDPNMYAFLVELYETSYDAKGKAQAAKP